MGCKSVSAGLQATPTGRRNTGAAWCGKLIVPAALCRPLRTAARLACQEAKSQGVPPYVIFQDSTLRCGPTVSRC
jgi:hypothetical protein